MRKLSYLVIGWIMLGSALAIGGDLFRMHPNSPMKCFKMPMFDEKGTKIWQCFGSRAHYLNNNDVDIENMRIEWFSPTDSNIIDMTVRSAQAKLSMAKHAAQGEGLLTIQNVGYTIVG